MPDTPLAECDVNEPIVMEAYTRLEEEGGKFYNKFFAVDGEPLTEITLSGASCPAPGTFPLTGTARGEAVGKKQKFNGGAYTLEILGEKATFTGETEQEGAAKKEGIKAGKGGPAPKEPYWTFKAGEVVKEDFGMTVGSGKMLLYVPGRKQAVECSKVSGVGTLEASGRDTDHLMFEGCKLWSITEGITLGSEFKECTVKVQETQAVSKLVYVVGSTEHLLDRYEPKGALITEVVITGCASEEGKFKVAGKVLGFCEHANEEQGEITLDFVAAVNAKNEAEQQFVEYEIGGVTTKAVFLEYEKTAAALDVKLSLRSEEKEVGEPPILVGCHA